MWILSTDSSKTHALKQNLNSLEEVKSLQELNFILSDGISAMKHQSVKTIEVHSHDLTHYPPLLSTLSNLCKLNLTSCLISSLPFSISSLTILQELNLSKNCLRYLPVEIGKLISLRTLDLSNNQLDSLPREIGEIYSLENLNLMGNKLTHLPEAVGDLVGFP
jgi:leucine-rich repeat protein SHOC2